MTYVDALADGGKLINGNGRYWAHMGTDDHSPEGLVALHVFAKRLGLKRAWFQDKVRFPHDDLTLGKHALALRLGAPDVWARATAHSGG